MGRQTTDRRKRELIAIGDDSSASRMAIDHRGAPMSHPD